MFVLEVLVQDLVKKITRVSKLECLVDLQPLLACSRSLATLAACPVAACNRANGVTALRAYPHNISINFTHFTWACDDPDYH